MQPAIEIKQSNKRGMGVFATRAILEGQLIIQEKPLLVYDRTPEGLGRCLSQLSSSDREKFLKLSPQNGDPLTILETNQIRLSSDSCAVFEKICRINHSCCPNSAWAWCKQTKLQRLVAQRDIQIGEEITVCYIAVDMLLSPSNTRRHCLASNWNFECDCPRCTATSLLQSDDRCLILERLNKRAECAISNGNGDIEWLGQIIEMLTAEGLDIPVLLQRVFYDAYQCVLPLDNRSEALHYLAQAHNHAESCPDLVDYRKLKQLQVRIREAGYSISLDEIHCEIVLPLL